MKLSRPIGIFDSGLGGLTVFKAIRRLLPGEDLIYFGDTAHVPYGSKSTRTVTGFSLDIAGYLASRNIKLLVVACNTASSLALRAIEKKLDVPVIGVIEPGAHAAARATRSGRIGVIGTQATVSSRAYTNALKSIRWPIKVFEFACPLFVPLAEEGWWSKKVTAMTAKEYLKDFNRTRSDTLILGCTHYPLLKPVIKRIVGPKVKLVDSAESTAAWVYEKLKNGPRTGRGGVKFIASDDPSRFKRLAKRLLGISIGRVEVRRFDRKCLKWKFIRF